MWRYVRKFVGYNTCVRSRESSVTSRLNQLWEDNKAAILIAENECSSAGRSKHIDERYKFVAQVVTEGSVKVRYTPTDMSLADVLTKTVPAATFERLLKLCLESNRGEYYVKVADEKVNFVSDEKAWMVTDMW